MGGSGRGKWIWSPLFPFYPLWEKNTERKVIALQSHFRYGCFTAIDFVIMILISVLNYGDSLTSNKIKSVYNPFQLIVCMPLNHLVWIGKTAGEVFIVYKGNLMNLDFVYISWQETNTLTSHSQIVLADICCKLF